MRVQYKDVYVSIVYNKKCCKYIKGLLRGEWIKNMFDVFIRRILNSSLYEKIRDIYLI